MHVECIVNESGTSVVILAENSLEEEVIKTLLKQENYITQIRGDVTVLNRSIKNGLYIGNQISSEKQDESKREGL